MPEVQKLSQPGEPHPAGETASIDVRKAVRQQLESFRAAGLTHLPAGSGKYTFEFAPPQLPTGQERNASGSPDQTAPTASGRDSSGSVQESPVPNYQTASAPPATQAPAGQSSGSPPANPFGSTDPWGPSLSLSDRNSALQVLQSEIADCVKCTELASQRTQTVFGVGNPAARLVFVGEGPGVNEDLQGEPFVGDAGKLLDKIMGACKLSRSDVFILNAVKCRPPGNRNPKQDELSNCWRYAEQQLEIIQPEFICCLGSVAARTLLNTTQSLGRLRKRFHSYRGSRVLVTYHPAYLLRTPSAKRHVWDDMKMLMKEMGVDLSN